MYWNSTKELPGKTQNFPNLPNMFDSNGKRPGKKCELIYKGPKGLSYRREAEVTLD
jgi:hypothetical protein